MSLPVLILKSQADRRLKLGHLWIYSNEVDTERSPLKQFDMGQQALVTTHSGKPLGIALMNPTSLICGRIINRDESHPLNKSLLVHRFKQSLAFPVSTCAVAVAFTPWMDRPKRLAKNVGRGSLSSFR